MLNEKFKKLLPMKEDERRFLIDYYKARLIDEYTSPRDIINSPGFYIPYKRAWYILEKWSGRDIYDWGVTLDLGWLTPEGEEFAKWLYEQTI